MASKRTPLGKTSSKELRRMPYASSSQNDTPHETVASVPSESSSTIQPNWSRLCCAVPDGSPKHTQGSPHQGVRGIYFMATKATHLELFPDLTTAAFIAVLNRFISRRGIPDDIYSDDSTNFVRAKKELDELLAFVNSAAHIAKVKGFLSPKGITFYTNPPADPYTVDSGKRR